MAELLFYLLSLGTLAFAVGVIAAKSPMMSVLSLLGSFVCLAGIYLLAGFQFLAAAQLLVYAGAIMVLFLFVVMLLNLGDVRALLEHPTRALGLGRVVAAGTAAAGLLLAGVLAASAAPTTAADAELVERGFDPLAGLAALLFSRYALVFQAAGLLLLVTLVAVVVLAKRQRGPAPRGARATGAASGLSLGEREA